MSYLLFDIKIERVYSFGMNKPAPIKSRPTVRKTTMPAELEKKRLNKSIELCRQSGDNGTAELLEDILVSEEEHVDWLEAQLELVKQVGEAHYLAQQIRE